MQTKGTTPTAGFTLDHYIHLMNEDDLGGPMEVPASPAAWPAAGSNGSEREAMAEALKPVA